MTTTTTTTTTTTITTKTTTTKRTKKYSKKRKPTQKGTKHLNLLYSARHYSLLIRNIKLATPRLSAQTLCGTNELTLHLPLKTFSEHAPQAPIGYWRPTFSCCRWHGCQVLCWRCFCRWGGWHCWRYAKTHIGHWFWFSCILKRLTAYGLTFLLKAAHQLSALPAQLEAHSCRVFQRSPGG